jgi:hypothetical protein
LQTLCSERGSLCYRCLSRKSAPLGFGVLVIKGGDILLRWEKDGIPPASRKTMALYVPDFEFGESLCRDWGDDAIVKH